MKKEKLYISPIINLAWVDNVDVLGKSGGPYNLTGYDDSDFT